MTRFVRGFPTDRPFAAGPLPLLASLTLARLTIAALLGTGAWLWTSAAHAHWIVFAIDACFLITGALLTWLACRGTSRDLQNP